MVKGFDDPKDMQQHGLKVGGTTYIVLRSTNQSIYAKRVSIFKLIILFCYWDTKVLNNVM